MEQAQAQLAEELIRELVQRVIPAMRRPVSTYRVQLNKAFGFEAAAALVPYLKSLGITDLYASPYLKAAPGSTHGYDVVDHNTLNPELGGAEGHRVLLEALRAHGMGHILDFVPNHMAIGSENPIWMDVLENGPSSIYAPFFDIDWKPIKEELENRVLVPILGDQYGAVLERGELKLTFENGGFGISYWDHRFPVAPRQYTHLLRYRLPELEKTLGADSVHLADYLSILTSLEKMPPRTETDPARIAERHREKEVVKRRLAALCDVCPEVKAFIDENVRIYNGEPGDPRSFDLLDNLLREQAYRLAYWRVAAEEINYRRFFDVNSLAAIRMEDPRVLRHSHLLVFELIARGELNGLRIDHPDGLHSPTEYFRALQQEFVVQSCRRLHRQKRAGMPEEALEEEWRALEPVLRARQAQEAAQGRDSPLYRPLYVVVEKILALEEKPPQSWPVHGTTGYDFMTLLNGLFVDRESARAMSDVFVRFTGEKLDFEELVYQKKRLIMSDSMSSEINVLARQLNRISELDRRTRDFTLNSLKRALIEVIACFPVYRTYVSENGEPPDERDRHWVEKAVARARRRNPTLNSSIFH
ncbi:MAG: malto-oligosyltrehalose synthase, partial [Myxococcales bacterium]